MARVRLLVNALIPEKVLLLERSVVEAAPMVILPPSETGEPLIVTDELARRELPIEVEATSLLFASVVTMELPAMFGVQMVPKVARVVEEFAKFTVLLNVVDAEKRLLPLKVLLLEKRVVEETVMEPPAERLWPLTVPRIPLKSEVPIVVDAITLPF